MSSWGWLLNYWFFWWLALVVLFMAVQPFAGRFRLWQARRRFIETEGAKLQNPQNADARFRLAQIYAQGGSWRRALRHVEDAVRVAGENPLYEGKLPYPFLLLHGECLQRRGRPAEAVDVFQRALEAKSDTGHGDARFGLGRILLRTGEAGKAVDFLRGAIRDNGSNLETHFRLAQACALLGREAEVEAARQEFREVAASLPRFARRKRLRWRLAFFFFPLTRHLV